MTVVGENGIVNLLSAEHLMLMKEFPFGIVFTESTMDYFILTHLCGHFKANKIMRNGQNAQNNECQIEQHITHFKN